MKNKRIQDIKFWQYEAEVIFTDGTNVSFVWDAGHDVSEDEAAEWMQEQGVSPESIEAYAYKFPEMFNQLDLAEENCSGEDEE